MPKEVKHFQIDALFLNEDNKYTLDEFANMLIEWAESKDLDVVATYSEKTAKEIIKEHEAKIDKS